VNTSAALAIAATTVGLVGVLASMIWCWGRRITAVQADPILIKLARAGSIGRIKKLAATAPNSYLGVYAAAIRAGEAASKRDPITVAAATHPAFEARAAELQRAWNQTSLRGIAGALLAGAGLYFAYHIGFTPMALRMAGGLGALGGVWFLVHLTDIYRAVNRGRDEVLPELDRALAGTTTGSEPAAEVESDA
jgi:hypothetical protein